MHPYTADDFPTMQQTIDAVQATKERIDTILRPAKPTQPISPIEVDENGNLVKKPHWYDPI